MQLTHIIDGRLKELSEVAEWEKAFKDVTEVTTKEKVKAVGTAEKKAFVAEKARALAKSKSAELEVQLGSTKLKLAEAWSLNIALAEELANLKAALEACEDKWYNEGFADAENSVEPVVRQAQKLGFEEGWLAAMQAMGVLEDSPLRNPNQIPFPDLPTAMQNTPGVIDEEKTTSMRELVEVTNSHVEQIDLEATSNPHAGDQPGGNVQPPLVAQQPPEDVAQL